MGESCRGCDQIMGGAALRGIERSRSLGLAVIAPQRVREAGQTINEMGLRHEDKNRDFNDDQLFGLGDDSERNDERSSAGGWMIGAQ